MSRTKGSIQTASNYELGKRKPLDARQLVGSVSDLTNTATWEKYKNNDGSYYNNAFNGMIVAVAEDASLYILKDKDQITSLENGWVKLTDCSAIADLQAQIDEIKNSSDIPDAKADVEVGSYLDLPATGMSGVTYYVRDTKTLYRWNSATSSYDNYSTGSADFSNIQMIYGGDANV